MEKILKSLKNTQINPGQKKYSSQRASILDISDATLSRSSMAIALSSSSSSSSCISLLDKANFQDKAPKTKSNPYQILSQSDTNSSSKYKSNAAKYDSDTNHNSNINNNNRYHYTKSKNCSSKNCPDLECEHKSFERSSEEAVRKKFKRVNKIFYNGFLNTKQDKHECGMAEYQAHASELLHFLKSLWVTNTMCDLSIMIENKKYPAHRVSLAMFSKKYRNEFQKQLQSKSSGIYTICLKCTTNFALEAILKYIYTAKIDINPANVEEILAGARELGIDDLICMATDYLSSLSIGDVLDYMGNGIEIVTNLGLIILLSHLSSVSYTYRLICPTTIRSLIFQ